MQPTVNGDLPQYVLMATSYFVCVYAVVHCGQTRVERRWAVLMLAAWALVLVPLRRAMDGPLMARIGFLSPYHILAQLPTFFILKGTVSGRLMFNVLLTALANFAYILFSYVAERFAPHGSGAYFLIWFGLSFPYLLLMGLSFHRWGQRMALEMMLTIDAPIWNALAMYAACALLTMRNLYFARGSGILPLPMRFEPGRVALPFFLLMGIVASGAAVMVSQRRAEDQLQMRLAQSVFSAGSDYYDKMARMARSASDMRAQMQAQLESIRARFEAGDADGARAELALARARSERAQLRVYCQSPVLNALLDSYETRCQDDEIEFSARIEPASRGAKDYELCIILGNLMENALAAARRTPKGARRFIELSMRPHGLEYGIMVRNSFDGRVIEGSRGIMSAKPGAEGRQGIGISSIRAIARRHEGEYHATWDGSAFTAYVVLRMDAARGSER